MQLHESFNTDVSKVNMNSSLKRRRCMVFVPIRCLYVFNFRYYHANFAKQIAHCAARMGRHIASELDCADWGGDQNLRGILVVTGQRRPTQLSVAVVARGWWRGATSSRVRYKAMLRVERAEYFLVCKPTCDRHSGIH